VRRVHVVGTSGSGKTTVAASAARRLGVPHVELDAIHWLPGWQERPRDEFRRIVSERLAADAWVVDGNYDQRARDLVWARADTVVWLDLPRSTVMWQVTRRTLSRWWRSELLWGTNREDLAKSLLTRDSILWWAWTTHARNHERYGRLLADVPLGVVRLRSRAEVDRWLDGLGSDDYARVRSR
jgi:adenylate kinase family enzyme